MGCNCASRLRETLREAGYVLTEGVWERDGDRIPDAQIKDHHLRITAMRPHLYRQAVAVIMQDITN